MKEQQEELINRLLNETYELVDSCEKPVSPELLDTFLHEKSQLEKSFFTSDVQRMCNIFSRLSFISQLKVLRLDLEKKDIILDIPINWSMFGFIHAALTRKRLYLAPIPQKCHDFLQDIFLNLCDGPDQFAFLVAGEEVYFIAGNSHENFLDSIQKKMNSYEQQREQNKLELVHSDKAA